MTIPYAMRPGAGFVLLVVVSLMTVGFFAWGASTPKLDRVWRISMELEAGGRELSTAELELLQTAVCDAPAIAEELGGSVLVRPKGGSEGVIVAPHKSAKSTRVSVRARTVDARVEGFASDVEPFTWTPPQHRECPTLIEVIVGDGKKKHRATRVLLKALK